MQPLVRRSIETERERARERKGGKEGRESCPAPLFGTWAASRFRAAQADNLLKAIIMAWFEAACLVGLACCSNLLAFVGKRVCPRTKDLGPEGIWDLGAGTSDEGLESWLPIL